MKHRYHVYKGAENLRTKTAAAIAAAATMLCGTGMALAIPAVSHAAGHPGVDGDCSAIVTDPTTNQTGTRADLYGCKPIGNSGEEQGIYTINASAVSLGYPAAYGDCSVLVKWSGDYGGTPYLDYGTVFNNTKCTNGYVENWGDRFDDRTNSPTYDPYATTPYVDSIGGQGSQIHP